MAITTLSMSISSPREKTQVANLGEEFRPLSEDIESRRQAEALKSEEEKRKEALSPTRLWAENRDKRLAETEAAKALTERANEPPAPAMDVSDMIKAAIPGNSEWQEIAGDFVLARKNGDPIKGRDVSSSMEAITGFIREKLPQGTADIWERTIVAPLDPMARLQATALDVVNPTLIQLQKYGEFPADYDPNSIEIIKGSVPEGPTRQLAQAALDLMQKGASPSEAAIQANTRLVDSAAFKNASPKVKHLMLKSLAEKIDLLDNNLKTETVSKVIEAVNAVDREAESGVAQTIAKVNTQELKPVSPEERDALVESIRSGSSFEIEGIPEWQRGRRREASPQEIDASFRKAVRGVPDELATALGSALFSVKTGVEDQMRDPKLLLQEIGAKAKAFQDMSPTEQRKFLIKSNIMKWWDEARKDAAKAPLYMRVRDSMLKDLEGGNYLNPDIEDMVQNIIKADAIGKYQEIEQKALSEIGSAKSDQQLNSFQELVDQMPEGPNKVAAQASIRAQRARNISDAEKALKTKALVQSQADLIDTGVVVTKPGGSPIRLETEYDFDLAEDGIISEYLDNPEAAKPLLAKLYAKRKEYQAGVEEQFKLAAGTIASLSGGFEDILTQVKALGLKSKQETVLLGAVGVTDPKGGKSVKAEPMTSEFYQSPR